MKLRDLMRAVCLVALAGVLTAVLFVTGLLGYTVYLARDDQAWSAPITALSDSLILQPDGSYSFTGDSLLDAQALWAILIDPDGKVIWSANRPPDVPETYTLNDVAAFARWYLHDYPVQSRIRTDGLLVVGAPKGSQWKYVMHATMESIETVPFFLGGIYLLALSCVVGLSALVLRRWFRHEQHTRDAARSDWIHGISHDIRTPLSTVMGYASELEHDSALPAARRAQAAHIRRQSQTIQALVGDLNLTMRLDYAMQPLRRAPLSPAALVRQTAADFLNGDLEAQGFALTVSIADNVGGVLLEADAFLLRRALDNLVGNAIRHNPEGCGIMLGAALADGACLLWVADDGCGMDSVARHSRAETLAADGSAPHGTGLKLVEQIARAHGGTFRLTQEGSGVTGCLILPMWKNQASARA